MKNQQVVNAFVKAIRASDKDAVSESHRKGMIGVDFAAKHAWSKDDMVWSKDEDKCGAATLVVKAALTAMKVEPSKQNVFRFLAPASLPKGLAEKAFKAGRVIQAEHGGRINNIQDKLIGELRKDKTLAEAKALAIAALKKGPATKALPKDRKALAEVINKAVARELAKVYGEKAVDKFMEDHEFVAKELPNFPRKKK